MFDDLYRYIMNPWNASWSKCQELLEKIPFTWQAHLSAAILSGVDCLVVAPTGGGKSLPMILPMLLKQQGFVLAQDAKRRFLRSKTNIKSTWKSSVLCKRFAIAARHNLSWTCQQPARSDRRLAVKQRLMMTGDERPALTMDESIEGC